ncbi:hypothetical protein ABW20_dc0108180 [Dactylellina cionopaga]|nr:hypothetical protein ABW20_dc0108180 [Dactylellina cionopaga]
MLDPTLSTRSKLEMTFRDFTKDQGYEYAKYRRDYHPSLYQKIIEYHTAKGGRLGTLLDCGCGPGTAVRNLGLHFAHAIGVDASGGMINTAKSLGGVTSTSEPIRFEISGDFGASVSPPILDGSVDVIIVATAAHWFDMSGFWLQAAKLLKPGGTVAIWAGGRVLINPPTPNHAEVTAAIDRLMARLDDYITDGNRINDELYINLPMPWMLETPTPEFEQSSFKRQEWGTDDPNSLPNNEFMAISPAITLDMLELSLGTESRVVRWREAHPEAAGTEQDLVRRMRREIEKALRVISVKDGEALLYNGVEGVLILCSKKA